MRQESVPGGWRAIAWLAACALIYVGLAIAIYVPVYSIGGPDDRSSWPAAFYARVAAAMLVQSALALAWWLALARWLRTRTSLFALLPVLAALAFLSYSLLFFEGA